MKSYTLRPDTFTLNVNFTLSGTLALRTEIASYLQRTKGVTYAIDEIVVSPGAKQCIFQAIHVLCRPGMLLYISVYVQSMFSLCSV